MRDLLQTRGAAGCEVWAVCCQLRPRHSGWLRSLGVMQPAGVCRGQILQRSDLQANRLQPVRCCRSGCTKRRCPPRCAPLCCMARCLPRLAHSWQLWAWATEQMTALRYMRCPPELLLQLTSPAGCNAVRCAACGVTMCASNKRKIHPIQPPAACCPPPLIDTSRRGVHCPLSPVAPHARQQPVCTLLCCRTCLSALPF